jgi:hypothetical protein
MKRIIKLIKEVLLMIAGYDDAHCKHEIYTKKEMVELLNGKSQVGHTHAWSEITGKPATFTPSSHTHDDRYFTESEINSKLATYKLKGDFYVVNGNITLSNGSGNTSQVALPSGFTKDNCVVVAVGVAYQLATVLDYGGHSTATFNVRITSSNQYYLNVIVIGSSGGPSGSRAYKIVMMKV